MSLWQWIAIGSAACALVGPFVSGMHTALTRGFGVRAGLVFGFRRFYHRAVIMTLFFLPATLCMGIVLAMAALPALVAYWVAGQSGLMVLCGFVGFIAGAAVALKSANRVARFIFDQVPNKNKRACRVCYRFREVGDAAPCVECGEPAPTMRCGGCGCERERGDVGPCPECGEVQA